VSAADILQSGDEAVLPTTPESSLQEQLQTAQNESRMLLSMLKESLSFQDLAQAVGDASGVDSLLDAFASALQRIVPWNVLVMHRMVPGKEPEQLLMRGSCPNVAEQLRAHREDGIVQWVLDKKTSIQTPPDAVDAGGWVVVPLLVLKKSIGWIELLPGSPSPIGAHSLEMLRLIASQAAGALDSFWQLEDLRQSNEQLTSLYELASEVGASLDPGHIFKTALDAVVRRLHPQTLEIWSLNAKEPATVRASCSLARAPRALNRDSILLEACRKGRMIRSARDLSPVSELDSFGVDVLLAIPFVQRSEKVMGGILIGGALNGPLDRREGIDWLQGLANLLSAAVENAHLFDDLLTKNHKLSEMQSHMVQTARMVGIGELAGGIAHEINNPLQVILGRTQILLMKELERPDFRQDLTSIEVETRRIAEIIRNLLEFSRQKQTSQVYEPVDLGGECRSVFQLLDHLIRQKKVQLLKVGFEQQVCIQGDSEQIRQMILNLCRNAIQAMEPTGGTLRLELSCAQEWALLRVSDTGPGIAAAVQERIFDPFYTTRSEASGLGLALCYSIAQRHQGSVELVPSLPGEGAAFLVRFPALPTRSSYWLISPE
jgi:signal transduction histidine kinase